MTNTRARITLWQAMKNYFNYNLYSTVSRAELLTHLGFIGDYDDIVNKAMFNYSTIDTYRNYLTKAGYLKIRRRGRYEVVEEIPVDLSIKDVKEEAYGERIEYHEIDLRQMIKLKHILGSKDIISLVNNKKDIWSTDMIIKKQKKKEFFSEEEFKI